mgnify:CR=1 FL=1
MMAFLASSAEWMPYSDVTSSDSCGRDAGGGRGSLYGSVLGFGRRFGYRLGLFCRLGASGNKASVSISAPVFGQWVVNVGHRYVGTLVSIFICFFLKLLDESDYYDSRN